MVEAEEVEAAAFELLLLLMLPLLAKDEAEAKPLLLPKRPVVA